MSTPEGNYHPVVTLIAPDGREAAIDEELAGLVTDLWARGYITIGCCQDIGASIGDLSPRKAAYWSGWVLLELPASGARRLGTVAAAAGLPMHWADEGAWEISLPVVVMNGEPVLLNFAQVYFPASQIGALAAAVRREGLPL